MRKDDLIQLRSTSAVQDPLAPRASPSVLRKGAARRLTDAILINPSYPTPKNGRGAVAVPEMDVGAATLPLLAAIVRRCRPDARIRMYDEIGTPVDMDHIDGLPRETTLVLLSVRTTLAYEARDLSARLRKMGFAVVMGGPHVSACIDEVAGYANAAVHGEAEVHLPRVIEAFEAGEIRASRLPGLKLKSQESCDLALSPVPERDLYRHSRTYMHPGVLEFGRGCQFRCHFCASTNLYTDSLRYKTVGQVLAEIATLPEYPGGYRTWFFGDDNFASSHAHAATLARAIGRRYPRARWGAAMTIASANDGALLDALSEGGMRYAFIGFDSIVQESLAETHKTLARAARFHPLIAALKSRGIFVIAALVFGFDHDRPDVFERTLDWALSSDVDVVNLNVLRPYPTTPTYRDLRESGRLLHDPWWLQPFETRMSMVHGLTANVSGAMTTFVPKHMSPRDLAEGTLWVGQRFYELRNTVPRLLRNLKDAPTLVMDSLTNYYYAREYRSFVPLSGPARAASGSRPAAETGASGPRPPAGADVRVSQGEAPSAEEGAWTKAA